MQQRLRLLPIGPGLGRVLEQGREDFLRYRARVGEQRARIRAVVAEALARPRRGRRGRPAMPLPA